MLTLKNVKIHQDTSEETTCFSATLYFDGRRVGIAKNAGHGGCNDYDWTDAALGARVEAWAAQQPTSYESEKLDQLVDELLVAVEVRQMFARRCRRTTLFRVTGDPRGSWRTVTSPFNPAVKAFLVQKYGSQLLLVANEDLESAIALTLREEARS